MSWQLSNNNYEYQTKEMQKYLDYNVLDFGARHYDPTIARWTVTDPAGQYFNLYYATGWKTGYVLAPANLMTEFRKVHQFNVFAANTPIQYALAEFMKNENHYKGIEKFYQQKRDQFQKMLAPSRFNILPCHGSYFQLLDYSKITDEKDTEYAKRLTIENEVASIPVSVFYQRGIDNKLLRFCFAKDDNTLEQAAERLNKI